MELLDPGNFDLVTGEAIPAAKLAYTTHGELSDTKDNVILFEDFLGGSPDVLESWIGEGRPLDPTKYFIVLPGHFALPPSSAPSTTPAPFNAGSFPFVQIADDVVAQRRLLKERFGVEEIQLVVGWSSEPFRPISGPCAFPTW